MSQQRSQQGIRQARTIEPWLMNSEYRDAALQLQKDRKEAGLSRSQMATLLDMEAMNYQDFERGEAMPSPAIMAQIRDILEKVRAGTLEVPNLNREE
jgi:transcriptional regulator with XRE-family HTH domain